MKKKILKQGGACVESVANEDFSVARQLREKRGKIHFIDDRMLASMDKCKLSTRNAIHLIAATASAMGHTLELGPIVQDLVLNRTTVEKLRKNYRRRQAHEILDKFNVSYNLIIC